MGAFNAFLVTLGICVVLVCAVLGLLAWALAGDVPTGDE